MPKERTKQQDRVVRFKPKPAALFDLTATDRMEIARWRDTLREAGYDRAVVHEREQQDELETGSFLVLHRKGEAWARWGLARQNEKIVVWSNLTGADFGEFQSLPEAFKAVLDSNVNSDTSTSTIVVDGTVVELHEPARLPSPARQQAFVKAIIKSVA